MKLIIGIGWALVINNGLIIQWGNHFYNNYTLVCTLPIAYKQKHLHGYITVAVSSEYGGSCYDLTLTTLSLRSGGGAYKRFLSIGI